MLIELSKSIKKLSTKGFTLVELLVVIGILGILAAAVLATINPVEQLKKAQDTSLKNEAAEYVAANVRYFSTHNALPWNSVANGGVNCNGGAAPNNVILNAAAMGTCTTALITEGELKQSFTNATNLGKITVTNPDPQTGNSSDTVACFQPQSISQQKDANTKYTSTGAAGAACKSTGGANNCFWCAR